ncbi:MAG: nucleoside deaminase [Actinomycetota bacterium]
MTDEELMKIALSEGVKALGHGDVPVGSVVVLDGEILSARHNERELLNDPSAHAEVLAIRDAAAIVGASRLDGATLVSTLEPCPMCAGVALNARVARVIFGAEDPKSGALGSLYQLGSDPRLNHEFLVTGRVLQDECGKVLSDFFDEKRQ